MPFSRSLPYPVIPRPRISPSPMASRSWRNRLLRVLDGIAFAQRVAGEKQFLVRREAYGFRRGRAKIAAHQDAIQFFLFQRGHSTAFASAFPLRGRVHLRIQVDERPQIIFAVAQPAAALLLFLFVLAFLDPPLQLLRALVDADVSAVRPGRLRCSPAPRNTARPAAR